MIAEKQSPCVFMNHYTLLHICRDV